MNAIITRYNRIRTLRKFIGLPSECHPIIKLGLDLDSTLFWKMTTVLNNERDTTDGLPKQFLSSLRILFDILDENQTGFIRLRDIESRWSDDGVKGLPPGVVEGLRKVTPPNGLLSFERFVSGLKLALMRKHEIIDTRKPFVSKENRSPIDYRDRSRTASTNELISERFSGDNKPQQPLNRLYQQNPTNFSQNQKARNSSQNDLNSHSGHQTIENQRKESVQAPYRVDQSNYTNKPDSRNTYSLGVQGSSNGNPRHYFNSKSQTSTDQPPIIPPRRDQPFRASTTSAHIRKSVSGPNLQSHSTSPPVIPPRDAQSSTRVLNELKSWQREWSSSQLSNNKNTKDQNDRVTYGTDGMIYANIEDFQKRPDEQLSTPSKATVRRHGSGRRHTLANGIDQNMLKRMKQLEEEMSVLRSGLAMMDTARDWYLKQIRAVSDKQAMLDKVKFNDNSLDAHQEKMNFQRARITEVNQHLHTLIESSEKGFPLHMNLAVPGIKPNMSGKESTAQNIKEQNRSLLEELNQKKEIISQLEKEKSTLVRELFEARSKNKSSFDDTTFM
ncbi:hypothetical protein BgiMline_019681 [Biomphalaria glabrata]